MTDSPLANFRPAYLRKSYPRETYPVEGEKGALALFQRFGLPDYMGLPTEAIAFRDETGWVRSICALFPEFGSILELRLCRHHSHVGEVSWHTHTSPGAWWEHNLRRAQMSWRANNYRGFDL